MKEDVKEEEEHSEEDDATEPYMGTMSVHTRDAEESDLELNRILDKLNDQLKKA